MVRESRYVKEITGLNMKYFTNYYESEQNN